MKINEIVTEGIKTGPLKGRSFQPGDIVITHDGRKAEITSNSAGSIMLRFPGTFDNLYWSDDKLTIDPTYEAELISKRKSEEQSSGNTNSGGGSSRDFSDPNNLFARSGKPHVDFQVRGTGKHWGNR